MDIFEQIDYLKKGIAIKNNEINSLVENRDNKIKLLKKEYEGYINAIEVNKKMLEDVKIKKSKQISSYSIFDITLISEILIRLMNNIEDTQFRLKRVLYETDDDCYYVYLVGPINKMHEYPNRIKNKDGITPNIDDDIFLLGTVNFESFYDNKTAFYNMNDKNLNIKKYSYIYDFINSIIKYKIENKKKDLTKEELNSLLDNYLFNIEKEKVYIKKRGIKKC